VRAPPAAGLIGEHPEAGEQPTVQVSSLKAATMLITASFALRSGSRSRASGPVTTSTTR